MSRFIASLMKDPQVSDVRSDEINLFASNEIPLLY